MRSAKHGAPLAEGGTESGGYQARVKRQVTPRLALLASGLVLLVVGLAALPSALPANLAPFDPREGTAIILVQDSLRRERGTAFAIADGTWLVTAFHVVGAALGKGRGTAAAAVHVLSPWTGALHEASLRATDPDADLALLRLENGRLAPLPIGELPVERPGALQAALEGVRLRLLGYPHGLDADTGPEEAVPDAGEGQLVEVARQRGHVVLLVDGAAGVQPGWSGGPVLRADTGMVVAVLSATYQPVGEPQVAQVAAVPVAALKPLLARAGCQLADSPRVAPPRPVDARQRFARRIRASALEAAGNWQALAALAREVAAEGSLAEAAYYRGLAAAGEQRWDEAVAALRESQSDRDGHGYLTERALAAALLRQGNAEAAVALAQGLEQRLPADAEARLLHARALLALNRLAEAEAVLCQARDAAPDHPWIRFELAELQQRQGRAGEARREYEAAASLVPGRPAFAPIRLAHARALDAAARYPAAEQEYRIYLRFRPEDARAHFHLANVLYKRGRKKEALTEVDAVLAREALPGDVRAAAEELRRKLNAR
ncbi:MAG: trypsin-like peptidase domain-containing protein [Armatimonadetes bacterium]|nr:trypsin-like peptidase domain-containing protein [Armatimonadota bacterium]